MVSILFIYFSFFFNGFHFRDEKTGALCWSDLLKVTARVTLDSDVGVSHSVDHTPHEYALTRQ